MRSKSTRKFIAGLVLGISLITAMPHSTYAASDEDTEHYDGRVQGYDPNIELKSWGTGGCWMMLIFLAIGCTSVVFKDAKRSHLD